MDDKLKKQIAEAERLLGMGFGRPAVCRLTGLKPGRVQDLQQKLKQQPGWSPTPMTRSEVNAYLKKHAPQHPTSDVASSPRKEKQPTYTERAVMSENDKKFDLTATADDCIEDLRRVQKKHPNRVINRNMYRVEGKYSDATWNQFFGKMQQFRRSAGLELSREQSVLELQISKHAGMDVYRQFYSKEVTPYLGLYDHASKRAGFKPIAVCSDIHDLMNDPYMVAVWLDTISRLQPTDVGVNGDLYDLMEFGEYANDPRIAAECSKRAKWCRWFLSEIRRRCPNARIVLNLGNHEWRLLKHMANRTQFMKVWLHDFLGMSLEQLFGVHDIGVTINCKWNLSAWKKTDVKKEVDNNYFIFYDAFVINHCGNEKFGMSGSSGHTHKPKSDTARSLPVGHYQWTVTGRMCVGDLDYHGGFDQSTPGFLIAHVNADAKRMQVYHEPVVVTGDFCVVGGTYYSRTDADWQNSIIVPPN